MNETINPKSDERHLTLVIPGLVPGNKSLQGRSPKRLEWLLGRANRLPMPCLDSMDACLFYLFGVEADKEADLPVAAVSRMVDMGVVDNAWWIRADPVHFDSIGDRLVLTQAADPYLSQGDADRLAREVLDVFVDDGWVLKAPRPDRWYLQPVNPPQIKTQALPRVIDCDIQSAMPSGVEGEDWHTVSNEIQILLHTSTINAERESRGEPAINGLWFWGGGRLPTLKESHWTRVWGGEVVTSALARLAGVPVEDRPSNAANWLEQAEPGRHILVLEQGEILRLRGQSEAWCDYIDTFDGLWTEPLIDALKSGDLHSLTIYTDRGQAFEATVKELRRWWRRRRRLASLRL